MKKKEYLSPETEIFQVRQGQMLTGSPIPQGEDDEAPGAKERDTSAWDDELTWDIL